ncbi:6,7-dimethyl-8-ribityllumazine synthase [Synoicihabitans lomoniglobus]|uniref:6,7-dimethyl-8-ribityllumazine synthase n=1 Tax=Synoicihabitans lomoniglobus TaxID=2909285 RepID=A0AAF0CI41_9BACT|nr:6,7-dimethyl-8-ribityllumazine synthase [Opitutaceae bacterium LMO-M01]WED64967.1 6,7-dimethyl-8-ribityllumazine synthase [Opitutaceae bacterium LMO-M01]
MSLDSPTAIAVDGATFKVGIVAARFNQRYVDGLLASVGEVLQAAGVPTAHIRTIRVPGSGELPSGAQMLLERGGFDVCIALGVIIKGGTLHDQLVAEAAQQGLMRISLDRRTPIIAGVVTANDDVQAEDRCLGEINRGAEFARGALEMAALKKQFSS